MDIRTENLTILFVDIAGFTATTSRQSRLENAHLLQTFERTLLPLIKRFKGNVVKSIGDALLITFRSPTDAMLCSMALQDAMHAHNLHAVDDDKIHIRVAANLGEVRVTKKDIFGEPVNVASRIEGVTPADEIYLSEAVYMAMNKAEVPAMEVGFKQLAGIPQAVRVYSIPRFATHRLVPQNQLPPDQGNELLFPYGGMHQRVPERSHTFRLPEQRNAGRYGLITLGIVAGLAIAWLGSRYLMPGSIESGETLASDAAGGQDSPVIDISRQPQPAEVNRTDSVSKGPEPASNSPTMAANPEDPSSGPSSSGNAETGTKAIASEPVANSKPSPASTTIKPAAAINDANSKTSNSKTGTANSASDTSKLRSEPILSSTKPTRQPAANGVVANQPYNSTVVTGSTTDKTPPTSTPVWSVRAAKTAYRAGQIDKAEYRRITDQLELEYEAKIRELKLAYRAKQISETEYEQKVREAKRAYAGP